jgi:galactokinase
VNVGVIDPANLAADFEARFGRMPRLYRAPGRVNLIGEHTDYNDGFVMPIALDRSTWAAAAPRSDSTIVVHSREYGETARVAIDGQPARAASLAGVEPPPSVHWSDYVRGVASVLGTDGADLLIASDVPIGSGLSSSAALEVAVGYALLDLSNRDVDLTALALACQRAEHAYAATRCGVMDQMIACHGRSGQALMLDTRTLQCRWLPLPDRVRAVVCNTMVTHQLAAGEYNARRSDCESGVRALSQRFPHVRALRDASLDEIDEIAADISDRVFRRCRHVVSENMRVEQAARALADHDFASFGGLMRESHASLHDDYEVSCAELDTMVAIAAGIEGVYGARMTGAGFGGCAVALVDAAAAADVAREIARRYARDTGLRPDIWIGGAGSGVSECV